LKYKHKERDVLLSLKSITEGMPTNCLGTPGSTFAMIITAGLELENSDLGCWAVRLAALECKNILIENTFMNIFRKYRLIKAFARNYIYYKVNSNSFYFSGL